MKGNQLERRNPLKSEVGDGRNTFGYESREHGNRRNEGKTSTPQVFSSLARRSVGRYILSTMSLAGECIRVYVPGPFGLIASSVGARVRDAMRSCEKGGLGPGARHSSPPGLSYDRFLSRDEEVEDGEDRLPSYFDAAIPDKYGRVSSEFLVRHSIGPSKITMEGDAATDELGDPELPTETQVLVQGDSSHDGGMSTSAVADGSSVSSSPASIKKTATDSFLKSLSIVRKKRNEGHEDDLDLLSDPNDEDYLVELLPTGTGGSKRRVADGEQAEMRSRYELPASYVRSTVPESLSGSHLELQPTSRSRVRGLSARNLINSGDESAIQMVKKLRKAPSKQNRQGRD